MIVCKVCGTENERGASFCGSCGSFLEWSGEVVAPDETATAPGRVPPASPAPVPPPVAATPAASSAGADTVAVPPETASASAPPAPPAPLPAAGAAGDVVCPNCGQLNEASRTYCRRCATELHPAAAATTEVVQAAPAPARSGPPLAVLGIAAALVLLVVVGAVLVFAKGSPSPSSEALATLPPSTAPGSVGVPSSASAPPASENPPTQAPPSESTTPSVADLTGLIVFSATKNGDADLWVWNPADGSVHRLLKAPGDQVDPSWSPDGKAVVYRDPSGLRMVLVNGKPANPPDFTHHAQDRHPAWSPDGSTVVFATDRSPFTSLDIVTRPANDNQAKLTVLVNDRADDWDPTWSPDGTRIVFVSRRNGHQFLYTMNADGTHQTEVQLGPGIYDDPMFSPDGQWLAFTRRDNADTPKALYVARADGSEMRRLTHSDATENDMSWSPDGRVIAVVRADDAYKIVLVDVATGNELGSIGVDGAQNRTPDWWWPRS